VWICGGLTRKQNYCRNNAARIESQRLTVAANRRLNKTAGAGVQDRCYVGFSLFVILLIIVHVPVFYVSLVKVSLVVTLYVQRGTVGFSFRMSLVTVRLNERCPRTLFAEHPRGLSRDHRFALSVCGLFFSSLL